MFWNATRKSPVIGAGVIGASWTAVFRRTVLPSSSTIHAMMLRGSWTIIFAKPLLRSKHRASPPRDLTESFVSRPTSIALVAGVDLVQENGPERVEFKQDLWARIEQHVPAHALLLSSSSAKTATEQSLKMKNPSRLLIGHPFNPPHLIPLWRSFRGTDGSQVPLPTPSLFTRQLARSHAFFERNSGVVANRLQRAIFRECCHLVLEGVVTVDKLDDIVTSSIGLRWAADGPFRSFHLGGGPGGFVSFFRQFAWGMEAAWKSQATVTLDEKSEKP